MRDELFDDRIAYRVNTHIPGRPALVCLHGLSGSSSAWFGYEDLLASRFNLITLDLRGHGLSAKPNGYASYSLEASADDVFKLLSSLGITQCTVVSHSYGALVALEFYYAHPDLISRLIFISPSVYIRATRRYHLTRILGYLLLPFFRINPFQLHPRGRVDYTTFTYASDWDLRRVSADLFMTSMRVYLYCLLQTYERLAERKLDSIVVPTLIIHGTHDTYIPLAHAERLARSITGATLTTLEGANHITILNNRPEILDAILTCDF